MQTLLHTYQLSTAMMQIANRLAQHVRTPKHRAKAEALDDRSVDITDEEISGPSSKRRAEASQQLVPAFLEREADPKVKVRQFNRELCEALVSADIPLSKLSNANFRRFLEVHTNFTVFDESTLRRVYVDPVFQTGEQTRGNGKKGV